MDDTVFLSTWGIVGFVIWIVSPVIDRKIFKAKASDNQFTVEDDRNTRKVVWAGASLLWPAILIFCPIVIVGWTLFKLNKFVDDWYSKPKPEPEIKPKEAGKTYRAPPVEEK